MNSESAAVSPSVHQKEAQTEDEKWASCFSGGMEHKLATAHCKGREATDGMQLDINKKIVY